MTDNPAAAAIEKIIAKVAGEIVVPVAAEDRVVAVAAAHEIVTLAAVDQVDTREAAEPVIAGETEYLVVDCAADDEIVARRSVVDGHARSPVADPPWREARRASDSRTSRAACG